MADIRNLFNKSCANATKKRKINNNGEDEEASELLPPINETDEQVKVDERATVRTEAVVEAVLNRPRPPNESECESEDDANDPEERGQDGDESDEITPFSVSASGKLNCNSYTNFRLYQNKIRKCNIPLFANCTNSGMYFSSPTKWPWIVDRATASAEYMRIGIC